MKHQKVSVDVWAMFKGMLGYLAIVVLGGVLIRLLIAVVRLPSRLNRQRQDMQRAMLQLQEKYPEAFKAAQEEADGEEKKKSEEEAKEEEKEENVETPLIEDKKVK